MSGDFKLENNDIVVTPDGDITFTLNKAELARQWLQTRLKTLKGEWFLDITQGIDWLTLLSKRNSYLEVDTAIKKVILLSPYIVKLLSYSTELDRENQKYSVTFSAQVEDGEVITFNGLEIN